MRVFQVASGHVGTEMVKRIVRLRDLQLVGRHCYSPEKLGRDVGENVGIERIGVTATIVTSADLPLGAFAGRFAT
jgi:4-hydroxy-tetrahydrodipicolinate reductase